MPSVMHEGAVVAQEYTKAKIPTHNAQLSPILAKYRDQMQAAAAPGAGGPPPAGN